jgi:hypothetical protein
MRLSSFYFILVLFTTTLLNSMQTQPANLVVRSFFNPAPQGFSLNNKQEVGGTLYLSIGPSITLNNMPLKQFKKLLATDGFYIIPADELSQGEEKLCTALLERGVGEVCTTTLSMQLNQIQRRLEELHERKLRLVKTDEAKRAEAKGGVIGPIASIEDEMTKIITSLYTNYLGQYLKIAGSREEAAYQISRALTLYAQALLDVDSKKLAQEWVNKYRQEDMQRRINNISPDIHVAKWFNLVRSYYKI